MKPRPLGEITLTLDPNERSVYVSLSDENNIEEVLESDDGRSFVGIRYHTDDLPIVVDVNIIDENKFSLIYDWIEEAIEGGLGDRYGDNHHKANVIGA